MIGLVLATLGIAQASDTHSARPSVAQVTVQLDEPELSPSSVDVVLVLTEHWKLRGLAPAERQRDPISTQLQPRVVKANDTEVYVFQGYRLGAHEQPGDTLLSYALLLEKGQGPQVQGYWYEDHMAVPTIMWSATGTLQGRDLSLKLTELTDPGIPGVPGTVTGLVRISP